MSFVSHCVPQIYLLKLAVFLRWVLKRFHALHDGGGGRGTADEELKGELGLDHFEGRSFPGWHHHVSVASPAMRSSLPSACGLFPPRPDGVVDLVRSRSRPERHFADSFITARLAIARVLVSWLPRCPGCLRAFDQDDRRHSPDG